MSGGKTDQNEDFGTVDTNHIVRVRVGDMNGMFGMPKSKQIREPLKIEVDAQNEVFYPVIKIVRPLENSDVIDTVSSRESVVNNDESPETPLIDVMNRIDEPTMKNRRWHRFGSRLGTVFVSIIAVIAVVLVGLRLAGFRTFTVMSGSMTPEYPVGALLYVKPVDYKSLKVGDVISYIANDDNTVVTHRIADIEIDSSDSNVWRFKTKGDANTSADARLVHYKNVLGTPIVSIPHIGFLAHNIQQPPGIYIALVVGTLLLAWTFLPGTLEERRKTARKSVA